MATRMQQRRATAEQWLLADPILAAGELGIETDTGSFKIGDGVNTWLILDYFETSTAIQGTIDDYVPLSQKGAALGVAELDANGFVPASQLDIDLSNYYTSTEVDTEISTAISALVDSAPGVLDTLDELAAAIGDDANFITTITNQITTGDATTFSNAQSYADSGDTATLSAAEQYADSLATNYDSAGSAATAETNANNYTDGEISSLDTSLKAYADQAEVDAKAYTDGRETAITTAYQTYADTAESDAVSTAAADATTKANAALSSAQSYADTAEADAISTAATDATTKANAAETNAKAYTDDLIGDGTVDGTSGNTVTDRISSAVSGLVDSAPATLDTLNELAAALNDDANFATTVTNSLATKAPLASPTFTGTVDFSNATVQGIEIPQPLHPFTMIG